MFNLECQETRKYPQDGEGRSPCGVSGVRGQKSTYGIKSMGTLANSNPNTDLWLLHTCALPTGIFLLANSNPNTDLWLLHTCALPKGIFLVKRTFSPNSVIFSVTVLCSYTVMCYGLWFSVNSRAVLSHLAASVWSKAHLLFVWKLRRKQYRLLYVQNPNL